MKGITDLYIYIVIYTDKYIYTCIYTYVYVYIYKWQWKNIYIYYLCVRVQFDPAGIYWTIPFRNYTLLSLLSIYLSKLHLSNIFAHDLMYQLQRFY